jgi:hypothetical protein
LLEFVLSHDDSLGWWGNGDILTDRPALFFLSLPLFPVTERQAGVHIRFRSMHIQNALLKQQKYLTLVQN